MPDLITRREGAIGWIVFSNPARDNAVSYEMLRALPDAVAGFDRDPNVRVIALSGEGKDFGSGGDIHEFGSMRQSVSATATYNQATRDVSIPPSPPLPSRPPPASAASASASASRSSPIATCASRPTTRSSRNPLRATGLDSPTPA